MICFKVNTAFGSAGRRRWVSSLVLSFAVLAGCRHGRESSTVTPPSSQEGQVEAWIAALKQELSSRVQANKDDWQARRDLALIDLLYGTTKNRAAISDTLHEISEQHRDPLAAYALALRSVKNGDDDGLWLAASVHLEHDASHSRTSPRNAKTGTSPLARQTMDWLGSRIGELPSDDARFSKLLDQTPISSLSIGVRREVLSIQGRLARVHQTQKVASYREQGCLQNWVAGPVESVLGGLALSHAKLSDTSLTSDPEAQLHPLSCAVRVWNPKPAAGYRRLQTRIDLTSPGVVLEISADDLIRVFFDGREIWRNDLEDRYPERIRELYVDAKQGEHLLEVALAIPDERSWINVRAVDTKGNPVTNAAVSGLPATTKAAPVFDMAEALEENCGSVFQESNAHPRITEAFAMYCRLNSALMRGDHEAAYPVALNLAKLDRFAEGQALLGDFVLSSPDLSASTRQSRAHAVLESAVEIDPSLTALRLAYLRARIERGEEGEVLREIRSEAKAPAKSVEEELFRFHAFLRVGDELSADQALQRAAKLHPSHCEVTAARFSRARSQGNQAEQASLLKTLLGCAGGRELAAMWYRDRGDYVESKRWIQAMLNERPDDLKFLSMLAEIAAAEKNWDVWQSVWQQSLALAPYRDHAFVSMADLAARFGDKNLAQSWIHRALQQRPHSSDLWEVASRVGIEDPLMDDRIDGIELVREFERERSRQSDSSTKGDTSASAYLLDRDVVEVYPDGTQRHLIHQIVRLLSKEAIDAHGEVKLPGGATVLMVRSIKPDGSIVDPESIAGKEGYSLRDLEVGDYVEQEFLMPAGAAGATAGRVDLGGFRFRSTDAPFLRSELIVRHPKGMEIQFESRNGAPEPKRSAEGDWVRWTFRATNVDRLEPEPYMRSLLDELPQVHGFAKLDRAEWLAGIADDVRFAQRSGPAIQHQVKSLIRGKKDARAKVEAIWKFVRDEIEAQGNLSVPASITFDERKGNRTMLLFAMLRDAGIRSDILLTRSRFAPTRPENGHPQFDSYDAVVLAIDVGDSQKEYLLADLPHAALGYLPQWLEGGEAYALPLHATDSLTSLKASVLPATKAKHQDARRLDIKIALDERGDALVQGRLSLHGLDAAQWRDIIENVNSERLHELFQQVEVAQLLPGASMDLTDLETHYAKDPERPLVLDFKATARSAARRQDGQLFLPGSFVSMNGGARYATLPERKLGMLIPYAPQQSAHVEIKLTGAKWLEVLPDATIESSRGSFRRASSIKGETMIVDLESKLQPGVIEAAQYAEFLAFVQAIRRHEQALMVAR